MKHYSLSSGERLKGKKSFDDIYSNGKTVFSSDKKFKAVYIFRKNTETPGVKIAAAVSRKAGKAVWRNRVKRLIKESYRLNKHKLLNKAIDNSVLILVVFSPNTINQKANKLIHLNDVMPGIVDLINLIDKNVSA